MCVSIRVCALLISVLVRLLFAILFRVRVCRCVCTVCLNWKAVIKCVDLSTISSSSQRQWRTNRSTAMSHQAPRITTPPSISLSLPPSTSTQLSITLSASHYTFLYPTLSKLPTITCTMQTVAIAPEHTLRFVLNIHLNPSCLSLHIWPPLFLQQLPLPSLFTWSVFTLFISTVTFFTPTRETVSY